jgi:hypothetical protein
LPHWPIWQSVAIAMVIINFFLAACKGDSLLYHCNCKGHGLLGTTIAGVIINYALGLASSHYNSGPGRKLARGCWLTDRVFSKGGKLSSFGKSDRVFSIFVWSGWSGRICGLSIASRSVIRLPVCLIWTGGSVVAVWPLSAGNWGCNRLPQGIHAVYLLYRICWACTRGCTWISGCFFEACFLL